MYELAQGLSGVFSLSILPFILIGVVIGLVFGVIPGLSGMTALVVFIPLTFTMEPTQGLAFLVALHGVAYTGGSITAVLLNIPGTPPSVATLIDGFPMTQNGQGKTAVGVALASSGLGGIFGGLILGVLIPILRPIVMSLGSAETFLLALLGISFVAVLGKGSMVKGLISGGLGVFIAFIGYQAFTGVTRFTMGNTYLYDGVQIIPVVLGIFAIPEILALAARGGTIARTDVAGTGGSIWQGIKETFHRWWLVVRCAAIGVFVGIMPGAGGETATFVAYGYAKQNSKQPGMFGRGAVEGVLAPESSNNAKEGGALVPTLALGIPGSAGMVILLAAFLLMGLQPGPMFLKEHLAMAYTLVGTLVLANILGVIFALPLAQQMARTAYIRGHVMAPILLTLICVGAFTMRNNIYDVLLLAPFGALGFLMQRFEFNRPAFGLAFVLASMAETYFHISMNAYGVAFVLRPVSMAIIVFMILAIGYAPIKRGFEKIKAYFI